MSASPSAAGDAGPRPTINFVIGAARSGTTWLARALGGDERVTATYETHLFNAYLAPVLSAWSQHLSETEHQAERWHRTGEPPDSAIGLPYVLTEDQLTGALQELVREVFDAVARARPGTAAIVEKTPSHSQFVREIDLLTCGRARFVHIIRDGYDVVESTIRSGSGWAGEWAPRDVPTAARKWAASVRGALDAAQFADRYHELRYEDLVAAPEEELLRVMRFVGLDADVDDAVQALERTDHGLFLGGEAAAVFGAPFPEPRGFRRSGSSERRSRNQVVIEAAVGGLLDDLGYRRPDSVSRIRKRSWEISGSIESTIGRSARLVRRLREDVGSRRPS